ncbi:MAG: hypothetical protein IPN86_12565 [Saprospiraceae bacterium]|nr:hypothetical protein [Saprospiraceae bacterium]
MVDLYSRYTMHAGLQFELQRKISIAFRCYMAQGPHRSLNAGANLRFAMGPSLLPTSLGR